MKYLSIIALSIFLNSCFVFHSGNVSSGPLVTTNDKYIDIANGNSRSVFFLGFGNLKKQGLVQEARKDLFSKRPLQNGEYYSNFTLDISKRLIFFIVQDIRVNVSADILRTNDTSGNVFGPVFNRKIATPMGSEKKQLNKKSSSDYNGKQIGNGDSVYYSYDSKNYNLYIVTSLEKETTILKSANANYKSILISLEQNTFFWKNKAQNNFKTGDKVSTEVLDSFSNTMVKEESVIIGFANNDALVRSNTGFHIVPSGSLKK